MEPKKNINDDLILRYIKGKLSFEESNFVKEQIQSNRSYFVKYVSLKEALYLMDVGHEAELDERSKILGIVKAKKMTHVQFILRFLKDKILVSASDQAELTYQGIMADFSYRGSSAGPVTITRKLDDKDITFIFTPSSDNKSVFLSVKSSDSIGLSAVLAINNVETEILDDLEKKNSFETPLAHPMEIEVIFKKKKEKVFSIGLTLHLEA
ncbi:hypothetical protein CLV96_3900 [Leptospira meyeri]|uniref:Uncharacterized protein n=1 Tax=Leptospira meyeri TaxID=29508 RepID=A0A4R8MIT5_LEPME|nr:hypothetical protein [Leptospira meyeri]EKJ86171.1 hypothetical protein LEP1GSC017_0024 [Leptospira meyeri serovar Hardjo str. Went 5]TDY66521.1 hypothetical protein CLV96_3900 [Leptospira meyeri]